MASRLSVFLAELKRRRVYHVAVGYLAVGVGMVYGIPDLFALFNLGETAAQLAIILIAIGFPIALVLAWAYEVRPEEPTPSAPPEMESPAPSEPASPTPAAGDPQRKSIVVLPFDNMSSDAGDAYFSDGLTEEITTQLSHLESLRVISRSSATVLKEAQKDVRTIGEELGVGYVLEGSVRKAGDNLRITAQLIDAETDAHLWAEKYEGLLDDVFAIQDRVSEAIVEVLDLRLSAGERKDLRDRPIQNPRAYECYLKAWHDVSLGSTESYRRAIKTLESGLDLYGENALLLAMLGGVLFWQVDVGFETDPELLDRARGLADQALALDPDSAHAKSLLANLERRGGNLTTAARLAMEAHKLEPSDPGLLLFAAMFVGFYVGQSEISMALFDRLLTIDPLTPMNHMVVGLHCLEVPERRPDGLNHIRKAWEMGFEFPWARVWIGYAHAANGQWEEAIRELEEALEDGLPDPTAPMARFFLGAFRGEREQALAALDPATREYAWNDSDFPFLCSGIFALIGETEQSLEWIQHGISRGCINYPHFAFQNPFLGNVRGDPRFQRMIADLKPKWEAFEF